MKFYFHNSKVQVTKYSYAYVYEYKRQLMSNLAKFLSDLKVNYVISHGNLIEYERGRLIYHDDDIDIRIDRNDIPNVNFSLLSKYNLKLVESDYINHVRRMGFIQKKICYWHHINLVEFKSRISLPNMTIFADLVCNRTNTIPWNEYDINYRNIREIVYMETKTFAPSKEDTLRLLEKEYGENWITPNYEEYELV